MHILDEPDTLTVQPGSNSPDEIAKAVYKVAKYAHSEAESAERILRIAVRCDTADEASRHATVARDCLLIYLSLHGFEDGISYLSAYRYRSAQGVWYIIFKIRKTTEVSA